MIRFAMIGAGYRGSYFLRVAQANPEKYTVVGILARSEEKAAALREKWQMPAFTGEEDIEKLKPDFVVVAVSKPFIADVALHWKEKGIPVLCETPVSLDSEKMEYIYETRSIGAPLMVSEQYIAYPTYARVIEICNSGLLGDIVCASLSIAHDYHGMSVMRKVLGESVQVPFSIHQKKYDMPVAKTHDRYQLYTDGEIIIKPRRMATVEFADGKVGFYDFDSEQYHSTIRHNSIHITGSRGEIINERCWYLDEHNIVRQIRICEDFQSIQETLDEDEAAVDRMLEMAARIADAYRASFKEEDEGQPELLDEAFREWEDNLTNALQDAYMASLLYTEEMDQKSTAKNWMESVECE